MHLITNPKQFDVIVCENLFGDILSDEASVILVHLVYHLLLVLVTMVQDYMSLFMDQHQILQVKTLPIHLE